MNKIQVHGKMMNKVEFFDYVYDVFCTGEYACTEAEEQHYIREFSALRNILRAYGWMDEYQKWVADGAGAQEAAEELRNLLKAFPVA